MRKHAQYSHFDFLFNISFQWIQSHSIAPVSSGRVWREFCFVSSIVCFTLWNRLPRASFLAHYILNFFIVSGQPLSTLTILIICTSFRLLLYPKYNLIQQTSNSTLSGSWFLHWVKKFLKHSLYPGDTSIVALSTYFAE